MEVHFLRRVSTSISSTGKYADCDRFIAQIISLICLALFYFPPKHPKGVPWKEAIRGLDYVGTIIVVPGVCLAIVGIINTTYMPTKSTMVSKPMGRRLSEWSEAMRRSQ